jgi:hypothetical protein
MGGVRLWRPDFSDSDPDGESDSETWDCKVRERHAVVSTFEDCWRKYKAHAAGRRFHLCLYSRDRPGAGDFVVQRAGVYALLSAKADAYDKLVAALDERTENSV